MTNAAFIQERHIGTARALAGTVFKRVPVTNAMQKNVHNSMRDLMAGYPFLASLASSESVRYHAVQANEFPIAATDGVGIYFDANPKGWFDTKEWTDDHRVFAHAHEILHVVREDVLWKMGYEAVGAVNVPRTPTCPDGRLPFDNLLFGLANDAIINATLIADRVGKPLPGIFTHPAIGPTTSTGEAYAILWQDKQQGKDPTKGRGPGGGDPMAGDQRDAGSMGDPMDGGTDEHASQPRDPHGALKELRDGAAERKVAIDRARNAARQAGVGSSHAEQMVEASRPPGVDWRSYVNGFLARAAGNSAWDFRRPARPPIVRELVGEQPYFSPSRGGNGVNHVMFVGDTSGSIGPDEHRATLGALAEMVADLNPRYLSVVWCDSDIQRVDMFRSVSGDAVAEYYATNHIPQGGGTDFRPPFDMVAQIIKGGCNMVPNADAIPDLLDAGKPDGLVYFTDLHGPAPEEKPDYPVLWLVTTDQPAPWGDRVEIDPQELVS